MKTFYFLAGLPRSGSTLLASILNQNPNVYVTPTSPMLDLLIENQNAWHSLPSVQANPFPEQLTNITKAMIESCWAHRPEPIIIDKNRGWCKNMPASSILFDHEVKVVITTRDLPSIMASWLVLVKKNPDCYMKSLLQQKGLSYSDRNIVLEMWENMVKDCMEGIKEVKRTASNRLLDINYDELVTNPISTIARIEEFLKIPANNYDFDNIKNENVDDDLKAWGIPGMHRVRSSIKKISDDPQKILGIELFTTFKKLEEKYL